ncbi:MAG: hypothetical protein ABEH64_13425 [Salinirussus sp.]
MATESTIGEDDDLGRWAALGIAVYLVVGLGTTVSLYLIGLVGGLLSPGPGGPLPATGGFLSGGSLSGALLAGLLVVAFLGAVIAAGLGLSIGGSGRLEAPAVASAISAGIGAFVTAIILVVLLALLSEQGTGGTGGGLGPLLGAVIGLAVGVGITGAAAAGVGERAATW